MADFTPIQSAVIAAGKALRQELLTYIKDNFDNLNDRIGVAEDATGRLPPIPFDVVGYFASSFAMDEALIYRVENDLWITAARLLIKKAGTSGSVIVDVEYSRNNGSTWASILSAPISAARTLGNYALVTGTLTVQDMQAGDLLRLNIDAVQPGGQDFAVYLENESA